MDQKTAWIWNGGEFVACDSVPLSDRGFRYGMSVFESFPVRNGVPIFLAAHYDRLKSACITAEFKVTLPPFEKVEALLKQISFDAFARIYVTAGDGSPVAPVTNGRVLIFAERRDRGNLPDSYALGCDVYTSPRIPFLGGLKTGNYWANVFALEKARWNSNDEALLFRTERVVLSACMANVFVVKRGRIKTPRLTADVRSGVVREWVLRGYTVEEEHILLDDLDKVDEIFLTSSWLGIMPVSMLDGEELHTREVAEQLRVEYEREIGELCGGG